MVAITVILAAVIAAFVLDLGDSVEEDPRAAVDIDDTNQSEVDVSVISIDNADGVAIVDSDGEVNATNGTLNSTGASVLVGNQSANSNVGIDPEQAEEDYTVQAFFGDAEAIEDEEDIDEAESSAVIGDFTANGDS